MSESFARHRRLTIGLCLTAILLAAFLVRARHFRSMYPYFYYQDEIRQAEMSLKVIREKTLKQDFFLYPYFPVYFNSVFYGIYFAKNNFREIITQRSLAPIVTAAKNFDAASPESIYLQRCISMGLGMLCVFGVWLMARLLLSETFALVACLIFAFLPLPVSFSAIAKNDIYLECSEIYSLYFMLRLIKTGKARDYIWSSIFAGICLTPNPITRPCFFCRLPH